MSFRKTFKNIFKRHRSHSSDNDSATESPSTTPVAGTPPVNFNCSVCSQSLENARRLPCAHIFCLSCIAKQKVKKGNKIKCPGCYILHSLPAGGATGFETIFWENRIQDENLGALDAANTIAQLKQQAAGAAAAAPAAPAAVLADGFMSKPFGACILQNAAAPAAAAAALLGPHKPTSPVGATMRIAPYDTYNEVSAPPQPALSLSASASATSPGYKAAILFSENATAAQASAQQPALAAPSLPAIVPAAAVNTTADPTASFSPLADDPRAGCAFKPIAAAAAAAPAACAMPAMVFTTAATATAAATHVDTVSPIAALFAGQLDACAMPTAPALLPVSAYAPAAAPSEAAMTLSLSSDYRSFAQLNDEPAPVIKNSLSGKHPTIKLVTSTINLKLYYANPNLHLIY